MANAKGRYAELELKLQARMSAARSKGDKKQAKDDLKALRADVEGFFDQAIAEAAKSGVQSILNDAKQRALDRIDGKNEPFIEEGDPDAPAADVLEQARSALGWVVATPPDPAKVQEVIARDRAAALKAGHPVGPLDKRVV